MMNEALLQIVRNEPSWCLSTRSTRLAVTRVGGHVAPVTFFADSAAPIEPYYIAPWWDEGTDPELPSLLAVLRGDFFCAPFGNNEKPRDGKHYPPHGESANARWQLEEVRHGAAGARLRMSQEQTITGGRIEKTLLLVEGHQAVYSRHVLTGMEGPMPIGHHPNHYIPDDAGQAYLSFAPYTHAHTYVEPVERPEHRGYSILQPDTAIEDLRRCPRRDGTTTDLTRYPARRGYEDIVILAGCKGEPFGWSALALPSRGYVWFSLKDPRVLVSTLLWFSNGGRHVAPWSGRNHNCIGIEEITGFFHAGIHACAEKNFLSEMGIATHVMLKRDEALAVNFIQGVARINPDFKGVSAIEAKDEETIRIVDEQGQAVEAKVEWKFARDGETKDFRD